MTSAFLYAERINVNRAHSGKNTDHPYPPPLPSINAAREAILASAVAALIFMDRPDPLCA